jgi:hypothetical protein
MNKLQNKNLFIEILNDNIGKEIFKYLSLEDELKIIILNKNIYKILTKQTFLHFKFLNKKLKDQFLFERKYKHQLLNLEKIKEILIASDDLFKKIYKQSNIMINIFYFSFLILGIDLFFLGLILGKDKSKKKISWYSQLSYIFLWIESLLIIIIHLFKMRKAKKIIKEKINKKLPMLSIKEVKNLRKKIQFRINNLQPLTFWYIAICFLFFYFPVLIKILFEKLKTSYEKAYITIAWFMFYFFLIFDLINLIYKNIKNWNIKTRKYKKIYNNGKSDFYLNKIEKYDNRNNKTYCNEYVLLIVHFGIKCFIFAVLLSYLKNLGRKFDNINYHVKWSSLFIPIYVINGFIFIWGILYIYSIKNYNIQKKPLLYLNIIIIILSSCVLSISVPQILDDNWNINLFIPAFGSLILTLSIFLLFFLIRNNYNEDKNNIYIPRCIEVV